MPTLFIFGLGYSARVIARRLAARGWSIHATGRAGTLPFDDARAVHAALARSSHVLSSVPPDIDGGDPVLARYGTLLSGKWLGYLSSTGVYGDTGGAWVDEASPVGPRARNARRSARAAADAAWLAQGAHAFRLPGIYGPGRSMLDRVHAGTAHRIDLPGQVFSRIHVDDIASGVLAAIARAPAPGPWNLADDLPAPQNAVVEEACRLLDLPVPPLQDLDEAGLSPAARAFYAENRRIANGRAKRLLGWHPAYPDYRSGLRAILKELP